MKNSITNLIFGPWKQAPNHPDGGEVTYYFWLININRGPINMFEAGGRTSQTWASIRITQHIYIQIAGPHLLGVSKWAVWGICISIKLQLMCWSEDHSLKTPDLHKTGISVIMLSSTRMVERRMEQCFVLLFTFIEE